MKYSDFVVGTLMAAGSLASKQEPVQQVEEQQPLAQSGQRFAKSEAASGAAVHHPAFTPYDGPVVEAALFEQFAGNPTTLFEAWKASNAKKKITDEKEEFSYVGEWAIEEPTKYPGFKGDNGLVLKSPAAHHAISRRFDSPLDNKGKTLVLQYEVKLQEGLQCGGAYVKLLSESDELATTEFSNDTPYQVMFGPDKCGATDKVHFIIRRKDPSTGEYEEKHLVAPPRTQPGQLTTLYTLVLQPDQSYEIRVNGDVRKAGSLVDEGAFRPALNPPKEVPDKDDTKPADWVDDEYIPDPDQAEKPEDWDESAPFKIPDPEAGIPADWREDLEAYVADPEAVKPAEWDDEEDGEWLAPEVENPECVDISGCGPWEAPLVRNPDYKGVWSQPEIENPAYKGEWEPRLIANPDYFEDSTPADLEPIGGLGFELWTMQPNIVFDNIYVGHSLDEAEQLGNATFVPKLAIEKADYDSSAPEPTAPNDDEPSLASALWTYFSSDPVGFVTAAYTSFMTQFKNEPVQAFQDQPIAAAITVGGMTLLCTLLFGVFNGLLAVFTHRELPQIEEKKRAAANKAAASGPAEVPVEVPVAVPVAAEPVATTTDSRVTSNDARKRA